MWLVGTSYNVCWSHASLRLEAPAGSGRKWLERTPAMAAGLTDHPWTLRDLLHYGCPCLPGWLPSGVAARPSTSTSLQCRWQPDPGSVWSYRWSVRGPHLAPRHRLTAQ